MASYPLLGGSALLAVSARIYERIAATTEVAAAGLSIFDNEVPETADPRMPYIVIGEATEANDDIHNRSGRGVTVTVHVHSNYSGTKEAKEIMGWIATGLLSSAWAVKDAWLFPHIRYVFGETLQEDERLYHGVMRFEVACHRTTS